MMLDKQANLKYQLGNQYFWTVGYYVNAVSLNEKTIAKYIRNQEKKDITKDKLSVRKNEDWFYENRKS